ncbi:MAG: ExeA family protein [Burkholderiales bacterium]
MYYAFFGLTQPPFKITPDTDVFFEGGNRGAVLEALLYAIANGEGIVKVTGEVGSGKTMLCRVLQTRLPENVETVYLANPSVSPDEILHAIAFEMHLSLPRDAGRLQVMHAINEYLLERHAQKKQVVVFVEESQGMPISTLEEVRLLSNLETKQHKLMQIVLFGQPELDENLRQPQIRQLRERITHSFNLAPLNEQDVMAYLGFRLRAAGYRGPDLFSKRVIRHLADASSGLTRRINLIADKALLAAFADATHNVSLRHVKAAIADSEFGGASGVKRTSPLVYALGGLLAGGFLGFSALAAYQFFFAKQRPPPGITSETVILPARPAPEAPPSGSAWPTFSPSPKETKETTLPTQNPSVAPSTQVMALPAAEPVTVSPTVNPVVAEIAREPNALSPGVVGDRSVPGAEDGSQTGAGTASAIDGDDILEQRLLATQQWLEQGNDDDFTVQLLGTNSPELLREHFKIIGKSLEIEKIFVYRTVANRRPSLTVLYGIFPNKAEAFRALLGLPEHLKLNQPRYRTIRGIRAELALIRS